MSEFENNPNVIPAAEDVADEAQTTAAVAADSEAADTAAEEDISAAEALAAEEDEELLDAILHKDNKKKTKKRKDKKSNVNFRRLRYGSSATILTAVVVAAVILLNVVVGIVADKFPIALDLSSNKIYTLSQESVDIAKKVTDKLEVIVFSEESQFQNPNIGSQNNIPELDTTIKEFYNALRQYKNHSDNNFTFRFIDPDQEPAKFSEYENKYEAQIGSILFLYGERHKMRTLDDIYYLDASSYQSTGTYVFESTVEKMMASTVYSLVSGTDRVVQVLVGHDEDAATIAGMKEICELNGYTFEELSIVGSAPFNDKAEVMLIAAPKTDYSAAEIKRVRDWVFNDGNYGRHLVYFAHPTADCPNLFEYINVEYKIQVTNEIIYETDINRMGTYNGLYALADVPASHLISEAANTAKLYTPYARRLTTTLENKSQDDAIGQFKNVLSTHPESAQLLSLTETDKEAYSAPTGEYPLTSMLVSVIDSYNNNTSESVYGSVIVSGSCQMAYSENLKSSVYKNEDLILEALNAVTGNKSEITISNKEIDVDTISFDGTTALVLGLGVFIIGLPVIVLIICLVVFLRRKNL